jgi:hypothetical protein
MTEEEKQFPTRDQIILIRNEIKIKKTKDDVIKLRKILKQILIDGIQNFYWFQYEEEAIDIVSKELINSGWSVDKSKYYLKIK